MNRRTRERRLASRLSTWRWSYGKLRHIYQWKNYTVSDGWDGYQSSEGDELYIGNEWTFARDYRSEQRQLGLWNKHDPDSWPIKRRSKETDSYWFWKLVSSHREGRAMLTEAKQVVSCLPVFDTCLAAIPLHTTNTIGIGPDAG